MESGLALLAAGKAKKLFISGVYHGVEVDGAAARLAPSPEHLACCIVLGHEADNTLGNALETGGNGCASEGYHSLRLVTAGLSHAAQPARILARHAGDRASSPNPVFPESAQAGALVGLARHGEPDRRRIPQISGGAAARGLAGLLAAGARARCGDPPALARSSISLSSLDRGAGDRGAAGADACRRARCCRFGTPGRAASSAPAALTVGGLTPRAARAREPRPRGPPIIAMKHQSAWDTFAVAGAVRRSRDRAQAGAALDSVLRLVSLPRRGMIAIDRGGGARALSACWRRPQARRRRGPPDRHLPRRHAHRRRAAPALPARASPRSTASSICRWCRWRSIPACSGRGAASSKARPGDRRDPAAIAPGLARKAVLTSSRPRSKARRRALAQALGPRDRSSPENRHCERSEPRCTPGSASVHNSLGLLRCRPRNDMCFPIWRISKPGHWSL